MKKDKKVEKQDWQEKAQEYLAGWQRAQADYENLKKEHEQKGKELFEIANAAFMSEVLPVYSHFKLAVDHIPEDQKKADWVIGIIHIKKQFQKFFKKYKIEEIKTVGEEFNHDLHEAVSHEEKKGFETDMIFDEIQPGYTVDGKVLSHAKVKVAK